MAVTASFSSATGVLTVTGDGLPNTITVSRNAAGTLLVNGGAVAISGGPATVANTVEIDLSGFDSDDTIRLDETSGALPRAVMLGGLDNDGLTGGSGADQLNGEIGNDTLLGKGGADLLSGGDGDDVLTGGDGDDQVFGEAGNDRMIWNPGDDTDLFEGGDGSDTAEVNGGNGAEQFSITANGTRVRFDRVDPAPFSLDIGTTEALVLNANGGDDTITAGNGLSTLIDLRLDGGTGNDTIIGGDGGDTLLGGDGNDTVAGGRGDDLALLGAGDDLFIWNPGDGNDIVEGQTNTDTLRFNGANINELIDIAANGGRVRFTRDVANIFQDLDNVERIEFHAFGGADTVAVHDLAGTDVRLVTVDLAASGGGGDTLVDQVVADASALADGVTVRILGGLVTVDGLAARIDIANAENAIDIVAVNGLGGNDTLTFDESNGALPRGFLFGGAGDDGLTGGSNADELSGEADNDTLLGKGGADILRGGDGDDVLTGGDGDDQVFGDIGNDRMIWNPGDDTDLFEGGDGIDTAEVNGGNGDEQFTLTANGSRVRFDRVNPAPFSLDIGTTETLVLEANGGNDTITAGNGLSTLIQLRLDGGTGNDTIIGGDGADILLGGDGNDFVGGGRGDDLALLGAGNDVFSWNPGDGNDTVEGQAGADMLLFNGSAINENIDIAANGGRARFFRDVGNIVQDIDDVETIDFHALGGADVIRIHDLAGTDVAQVRVDLAAGGGGDSQVDQVLVDGTAVGDVVAVNAAGGAAVVEGLAARIDIVGAEPALDVLTINGLGGNDRITVNDLSGTGLSQLRIDLANGGVPDGQLDQVAVNATAGVDVVSIQAVSGTVTVDGLAASVGIVNGDAPLDTLTVAGLGGDDTITAGNGLAALIRLTIDGGAGNDTIIGGDGGDTLLGGDGNDGVIGGRGNDLALLGSGNDVFSWNPGDGNDTVEGQTGADTLQFNGANINERIDMSANGGRFRFTRDVANIVQDLDGVETIDFHALGGADIVTIHDLAATDIRQVKVDLGATGGGGDAAVDQVIAEGTDGGDVVTVRVLGGAVVVQGLSARLDIANAESANDQLAINGLGGNDTINADGVAPGTIKLSIDAGTGNDTITGSQDADIVLGGDGTDRFIDRDFVNFDAYDGGAGVDTIDYSNVAFSPGLVTINLATGQTVVGGGNTETIANFERVVGSGGGETIVGSSEANVLDGGAGDDTIDGGDGNDVLIGGLGADALSGGLGIDRAQYLDAAAGLVADLQVSANNAGAAAGDTYSAIENLSGSAFGDTLSGEAGANTISGGTGNDTLAGRDGDDTLNGDDGNDVLTGGIGADALAGGAGTDRAQYVDATAGVVADLQVSAGNTGIAAGDTYSSIETLFGSNFNDSLRGDGGGNTIWGRNGNDLVSGRDGNDTLLGGAGNDTLIGGDGADRYVFDTTLNASTNVDRLSDFSVADDTVALDRSVFDVLPAGVLASAAFFAGNAAHDADDRIIYQASTGALFYDADGNGAGGAVQFATLATGLALSNNDFLGV